MTDVMDMEALFMDLKPSFDAEWEEASTMKDLQTSVDAKKEKASSSSFATSGSLGVVMTNRQLRIFQDRRLAAKAAV